MASNEYIVARQEQDGAQLRALLLQGMESGSGSEMDDAYFERLRERVRKFDT